VNTFLDIVAVRFRPKMVAYTAIIGLAIMHYMVGLPYFEYVALGFLLYAVWKLFSCGCWKSQLRVVAALSLVLLAGGATWQPIVSVPVALLSFEMFL
jgi:hypothetical protein